MKQTKKILFATIMLITAMTVYAGGASEQTGGGGNAPATRTAADLARALGGRATVSGDTVTLTGNVDVERNQNLVVPEGVTLDLTTVGLVIILKDGAILTVNGTVNAYGGWGDTGHAGGLIIDGTTTINGSGTINLRSRGNLLNISGDSRRLILDGVTLVGLADNNESLVNVNNGGEFILKSGAITGNTFNSNEWAGGGGVNVYRATFIMEGGTISNNSTVSTVFVEGGGVFVGSESNFIMEGGEIFNNIAVSDEFSRGGGVGIGGSIFTMTGGTISGNTAKNGGGVYANGYGYNVTFTMTGGTISNNSAVDEGWSSGGGVVLDSYHNLVTFIMSGGTISGNTTEGFGGGVLSGNGSTFIMSGGEIFGNTTTSFGGGVTSQGSLFTMTGGKIYGNSARSGGGIALLDWSGSFVLEGGTVYGSNAGGNSNIAPTGASLFISTWTGTQPRVTSNWGTGGIYTRNGVPQSGGSAILPTGVLGANTNETLIAIPGR
jgi:hypothetical protein